MFQIKSEICLSLTRIGKTHGLTSTHAHPCTFETGRVHGCPLLHDCPCTTSGNKTEIYRLLHSYGLVHSEPCTFFASSILLFFYSKLYHFSSLKIIVMAFLYINACEFLIFLITLPKNKKNTSLSAI